MILTKTVWLPAPQILFANTRALTPAIFVPKITLSLIADIWLLDILIVWEIGVHMHINICQCIGQTHLESTSKCLPHPTVRRGDKLMVLRMKDNGGSIIT